MGDITVNTTPDAIDNHQWKELENARTANFFQTKECYEFYRSLPHVFTPFVFSVTENQLLKGIVVGYVTKEKNPLKQFFSRRAIIIGGPMIADDISEPALTALLTKTREQLENQAIYVETRNFKDYSAHKTIFEKCGFSYQPHLNFHIDTTSDAIVNDNMGKSRKRDVKNALKNGALIDENPTLDDVKKYYDILRHLYKTRVKTPLFPLDFFLRLYESDFCKFITVKFNDQVIGGTVCVGNGGTALYEWFACGEDRKFRSLYPSNLATYGGIIYATRNGYRYFDMMGAGKPDANYGVRAFKAKFGGTLVEHGRFLCVNHRLLYSLGKLVVSLFDMKPTVPTP